ncbi:MAG: CDGSH iron-sulfur domain-containing protein [Pseudomonadota bacterium]
MPKVTAIPNGPLVAEDIPDFILPDGTKTHPKEKLFLCRCGQSKNKPFCDGAHKDAGFDSSPDPERAEKYDRGYSYAGKDVTVHFSKLLCSHAGECGKRAAHIFNVKEKPWVKPDEGTLDQIKEVVANCPSGALRFEQNDGPEAITDDAVKIEVEKNGPYWVRNVDTNSNYWADGQSEKKYVLCRCGLSKNKPFCDGTHYEQNWIADV